MNCPYCNAQLDETADRCTTCLKHLPHQRVAYQAVSADFGAEQSESLGSAIISGNNFESLSTSTNGDVPILAPRQLDAPNEPLSASSRGGLLWKSITTGLLVGVGYFIVSRIFDAIIILPIFAGFLTASMLTSQIKSQRIHNAKFALLCGLIAGILAYSVKTVGEAYTFRYELVRMVAPGYAQERGRSLDEEKSILYSEITPLKTMQIYFGAYTISIGHMGMSSPGDPGISGPGYWFVMLLECSILAGIAATGSKDAASSPYCESCKGWLKNIFITGRHPDQANELIDSVRKQDWGSVADLPVNGVVSDKGICRLTAFYCPACKSGLAQVSTTVNNKTKKLFIGDLTVQSMAGLRKLAQDAT